MSEEIKNLEEYLFEIEEIKKEQPIIILEISDKSQEKICYIGRISLKNFLESIFNYKFFLSFPDEVLNNTIFKDFVNENVYCLIDIFFNKKDRNILLINSIYLKEDFFIEEQKYVFEGLYPFNVVAIYSDEYTDREEDVTEEFLKILNMYPNKILLKIVYEFFEDDTDFIFYEIKNLKNLNLYEKPLFNFLFNDFYNLYFYEKDKY